MVRSRPTAAWESKGMSYCSWTDSHRWSERRGEGQRRRDCVGLGWVCVGGQREVETAGRDRFFADVESGMHRMSENLILCKKFRFRLIGVFTFCWPKTSILLHQK